MKYFLTIPALILLATIFTGCPYESNVALDNSPKVKINGNLLGDWYLSTSETSKMMVEKINDFEYTITKLTADSSKVFKVDSRYKAFLSDVSGTLFLNAKSFQAEGETAMNFLNPNSFYIYKVEVSDKTFSLFPVSDYIKEKFDSEDNFRKFVEKYKDLSFFYSAEEKYVK